MLQVPVYIAEITPKDLRGGFTTVHQVKSEHHDRAYKTRGPILTN